MSGYLNNLAAALGSGLAVLIVAVGVFVVTVATLVAWRPGARTHHLLVLRHLTAFTAALRMRQ